MEDIFRRYGVFTLVLLIGISSVAAALLLSKKRMHSPSTGRSVWEYMLVWPLFYGNSPEDNNKRAGRLFTDREVVGWVILAVLIVLAVGFNW